MSRVHTVIVTTQRELDDALELRDLVFRQEMSLIRGEPFQIARELNGFDTLDTTIHVLAYAGSVPVATVRMLLPNLEVARDNGTVLGIDLERKLDLRPLGRPGMLVAEVTRLCVRREWRHSEAVLQIARTLYRESRGWGITHWVGSTNVETDSSVDAQITYRLARARGLVSTRYRVKPKVHHAPATTPSLPLYTPLERARARRATYDGLRLPGTLAFLVGKLGARFIAEPIFDSYFRMYSMPLIIDLDTIPARTAAHFGPPLSLAA
jgi:hypothetical protein